MPDGYLGQFQFELFQPILSPILLANALSRIKSPFFTRLKNNLNVFHSVFQGLGYIGRLSW